MNARLFLYLSCLLLLGSLPAADSLPAPAQKKHLIRFSLRNNSWQFRRFTIITYEPGQTGNGATSFTLAPGMRRHLALPVGTRLYNASSVQVNTVMSGQSITGEPLLIVSKYDRGSVVPLVR